MSIFAIKKFRNAFKKKTSVKKRFKRRKTNKTSKLEESISKALKLRKIDVIPQFKLCGYKYDFKVKNKKILIEVDGDFWHVNPKLFEAKYQSQHNSIANDSIKNQIAIDEGYKLLRFWESDIKADMDKVMNKIIQVIR